jgi:hypothetical protein
VPDANKKKGTVANGEDGEEVYETIEEPSGEESIASGGKNDEAEIK